MRQYAVAFRERRRQRCGKTELQAGITENELKRQTIQSCIAHCADCTITEEGVIQFARYRWIFRPDRSPVDIVVGTDTQQDNVPGMSLGKTLNRRAATLPIQVRTKDWKVQCVQYQYPTDEVSQRDVCSCADLRPSPVSEARVGVVTDFVMETRCCADPSRSRNEMAVEVAPVLQ